MSFFKIILSRGSKKLSKRKKTPVIGGALLLLRRARNSAQCNKLDKRPSLHLPKGGQTVTDRWGGEGGWEEAGRAPRDLSASFIGSLAGVMPRLCLWEPAAL